MTISEDPWCTGELKGDPDIAGIGVVSSIFATTGCSILASSVLWWLRYIRGVNTKTSQTYKWALKSAFILADIQLATAGAIVVSSLILIKGSDPTSLYHVFIARGLANCNMLGHGAALIFDTRKQLNWGIRLCFLTILIGLYFWWTVLAIQEWDNWSHQAPNCFFNDSIVPGWYTSWMWVDFPWQIAGYAWLYLEYLAKPEKWLDNTLKSCDQFAREIPSKVFDNLPISKRPPRMSMAQYLVMTAFGLAKAMLLFFVALPIALLGFQPPSLIPFSAVLLFAWSAYDVVVARASNQHMLVSSPSHAPSVSLQGNTNPENDWGFGQLLPLCLLILPIIQVIDNFVETKIE